MDRIDDLLRYIRKTNSEMTRERLIHELSQCRYSAVGLIMTWKNSEKAETVSKSMQSNKLL